MLGGPISTIPQPYITSNGSVAYKQLGPGDVNQFLIGGYGTVLSQIFSRNFPNYSAQVTLTVPIRNRANQADLIGDEIGLVGAVADGNGQRHLGAIVRKIARENLAQHGAVAADQELVDVAGAKLLVSDAAVRCDVGLWDGADGAAQHHIEWQRRLQATWPRRRQ